MAKSITEQIFDGIVSYNNNTVQAAAAAARRIQREMLAEVTAVSPVRKYPTPEHDTGVVKEITVHRNPPAVPKAVHTEKAAYYQPGYFKAGWASKTNTYKDSGAKRYFVYNKNMPTVTHLLNFDHVLVTHGALRGVVHGSRFLDDVQEKAMNEFENELSRIYHKE
ncbi:MAG: hypothetical protein LIO69_02710 [Oscillospiraceae bacterium]|nr:hypothetical protein [Oscillospiraceae bacterium]